MLPLDLLKIAKENYEVKLEKLFNEDHQEREYFLSLINEYETAINKIENNL